jgi:hypothetical protein
MYLLFRWHHKLPHEFYDLELGEQQVIKAFMSYEADERNKELKEIEKEGGT